MTGTSSLLDQCTIDVSAFAVAGSFLVFVNLLILFLVWQRQSIRTIFLYTGLFTWFCAVSATLSLFTDLIPLATDGQSYFKWACHIAASGFNPDVIQTYVSSEWTKFGLHAIAMLEAGLIYLTYPSYEFIHIGQIFVATLAVFFAARFAVIVFGENAAKYVVFGFVVYFAWYWRVLHNLREAPLLCAMGIALTCFALWWFQGKAKYAALALIAGTVSAMFRPENVLIMVAVGGLAIVYRHPSWIRAAGKALFAIPPLVLIGVDLAFRLTNNAPIRLINNARAKRTEAGHHLANLDASSFWDLLYQLPETFRYFLISIWPWDLSNGLIYLKAYVHSVTAFVFIAVAIVGLFALRRLGHGNGDLNRLQWTLLIGFSLVAGLYSIIDIGAGVAARHSTFYFYFLLSSFVPVGLWALRNLSAKIVYRGLTVGSAPNLGAKIAHSREPQ